MTKTNKLWYYFVVGFKLFLIGILAALIMFIPRILAMLSITVNLLFAFILLILLIPIGWTVGGWLIVKFKSWVFRK